jgi:hypothetical protein
LLLNFNAALVATIENRQVKEEKGNNELLNYNSEYVVLENTQFLELPC